jgi:hypothetical protein
VLNSKVSQNSRLELVGDSIQLFSPYHADLVRDMRGIEGRRWNSVEKCNLFPTTAVGDVLELAAKWDIPVPTDVSSLPPLVEEVIPDWGLEVDDSSPDRGGIPPGVYGRRPSQTSMTPSSSP